MYLISLSDCKCKFLESKKKKKTQTGDKTYSVFTETGATQTMTTNQMAELKQQIPTFSNGTN